MSNHKCPSCVAYLKKVRRDENSMLNAEQFDAVKLGDWFCDKCADHGEKYRYFWDRDLVADASTQGAHERLARAKRALTHAGFTYVEGAAEWKPPLGKPPRFIEVATTSAGSVPVAALNRLGARLAVTLDEDQFNTIEPFLNACAIPPANAQAPAPERLPGEKLSAWAKRIYEEHDATNAQAASALTTEQQRTIEHASTKLENIGHIFAGDKESRRLAAELRAILNGAANQT